MYHIIKEKILLTTNALQCLIEEYIAAIVLYHTRARIFGEQLRTLHKKHV